jgi:L-alanine-DL-glutamate epimerase-like enolase superfamily enzyme
MRLIWKTFTVNKRFALTISRGTTAKTTNIWLRIFEENIEGWGEASPFAVSKEEKKDTIDLLQELAYISPKISHFHPLERQQIEAVLSKENICSAVRTAIDTALYDWMGKKAGLPLWQIWGLDRSKIVPTSVTVGISTPEAAKARVRDWLDYFDPKVIKVKLGSPEGLKADRAMFAAVKEEVPNKEIMVDANGGWNVSDAIAMCEWLAKLAVKYVEQPLAVGEEAHLETLRQHSPLPIFVDESCFSSADILSLADRVDGINIKLMKTGGLTEAKRTIDLAKACGLKIMFGCYSDSSLANTAMSHLAPLADYLDLDSHLNLLDDPFSGATLTEGRSIPNDRAGLGVSRVGDSL